MDPSTIQSMLVQQLGSRPSQPGAVGGGSGGPAMQGQTSGANLMAQLAQKAMLMKALQGSQQTQAAQQFNTGQPAMNAQMANDPNMQAMQQPAQLDPTALAMLQQSPAIAPPAVPGQ